MSTAEQSPELLDKLPQVPSQLIRLAIQHIKRANESPDMVVDMGSWHQKDIDGRCYVCFAGAVMHFGLKPPSPYTEANGHHLTPSKYDSHNNDALWALNYFRSGYVAMGCFQLGARTRLANRSITCAEHDFSQFVMEMEQLAADFEAEGN